MEGQVEETTGIHWQRYRHQGGNRLALTTVIWK